MAVHKAADTKKPQSGQLRIVAGNWRSRRLQIAVLPGFRPTSERVRETLFNWLAPRIHGARCLDLCAGTGALGIEALSRGASRAVFIEKSPIASKTLTSNLASLAASGAEVLNIDARSYLQRTVVEAFDIVFIDPPFAADLYDELCRLLIQQNWLAPDARIYIEMHAGQPEISLPDEWQELKNKTAGKVRFILARNEN